jgi:branched-chain amino acid transport system substrate-binding protein
LIPTINRASGGPLPMISPLNTYAALTRGGPHVDQPEEVSTLYPTGRRNFVRVIAADDGQGAAFALFARERGRRRLFVLEDRDDGYGGLIANAFRRVARQLGTKVVGFARWNATDRGYTPLARRIRAARADAVMVAGQLPNNGGRLIRDLRSVLGRDVDLMVPDGMAPPAALSEVAGRAARGVFMSITGVVIESLPPAGAKFVKRFALTQRGIGVEAFAVYAAQATETLLDAIGRSNGTRAGVLNELFRTQTKGGLVGDIAFDSQGDIQQGAVTILRVTGSGKGTSNILSTAGSRLERTLFVSPKLIG